MLQEIGDGGASVSYGGLASIVETRRRSTDHEPGLGLAALQAMPAPTLLMSTKGIYFMNRAAERMLAACDTLRICPSEGLMARSRAETQRLRTALSDVLLGGPEAIEMLVRAEDQSPLLVAFTPVGGNSPDEPRKNFVLITIGESVIRDPEIACRVMMLGFALTATEARVACSMARGDCVKRIAAARGVGVTTVRTQFSQILAKTHSHNQRNFMLRFRWLAF